jgi:hypothetical protein
VLTGPRARPQVPEGHLQRNRRREFHSRPSSALTGPRARPQVLSLKGIRSAMGGSDFTAIAGLPRLEELVLDCDQPPEAAPGAEEVKWGLGAFPDGMLHLANMTHLTLSCHYGVTALPPGVSRLAKLQARARAEGSAARRMRAMGAPQSPGRAREAGRGGIAVAGGCSAPGQPANALCAGRGCRVRVGWHAGRRLCLGLVTRAMRCI